MRYERDLSQEKLAELSNSSANYISDVELGKRNVSIDFLHNLSKALDVPTYQMLKETKKVEHRIRVDSKK